MVQLRLVSSSLLRLSTRFLFWPPIIFVPGQREHRGTLLDLEQATLPGLIVGMSSNVGQAVDIVNIESESRPLIFPSSSALVVRP